MGSSGITGPAGDRLVPHHRRTAGSRWPVKIHVRAPDRPRTRPRGWRCRSDRSAVDHRPSPGSRPSRDPPRSRCRGTRPSIGRSIHSFVPDLPHVERPALQTDRCEGRDDRSGRSRGRRRASSWSNSRSPLTFTFRWKGWAGSSLKTRSSVYSGKPAITCRMNRSPSATLDHQVHAERPLAGVLAGEQLPGGIDALHDEIVVAIRPDAQARPVWPGIASMSVWNRARPACRRRPSRSVSARLATGASPSILVAK